MKQKWDFGPYTTYLWTLITILITVAIIFVCTCLPGLLWDLTSGSTGSQMAATLDLPDVEEIISASVDTNAIPPYYPPLSSGGQNPDTGYTLVAVDDVSDAFGTPSDANQKIATFSELVVDAMNSYFYLSCSPSIIAQHTNVWSVCQEGASDVVDIYYSTTVVVQQHTHLWTVTAYGSPTGLTHLSRTPYSDSDNTSDSLGWDDEELREQIVMNGEATKEVQKIFSDFLTDSAAFDKQLFKESADILESENYKVTAGETIDQEQLYTVRFWSDTYDTEFEMVIRIFRFNGGATLQQILSVSQVK